MDWTEVEQNHSLRSPSPQICLIHEYRYWEPRAARRISLRTECGASRRVPLFRFHYRINTLVSVLRNLYECYSRLGRKVPQICGLNSAPKVKAGSKSLSVTICETGYGQLVARLGRIFEFAVVGFVVVVYSGLSWSCTSEGEL